MPDRQLPAVSCVSHLSMPLLGWLQVLVSPLVIAGWCGLISQVCTCACRGSPKCNCSPMYISCKILDACALSVIVINAHCSLLTCHWCDAGTAAAASGEHRWGPHGPGHLWARCSVPVLLLHLPGPGAGPAGLITGPAIWTVSAQHASMQPRCAVTIPALEAEHLSLSKDEIVPA